MISLIFSLTLYVASVVQRVTAWVAGVLVLKLVHEEMYAMRIRKGDSYVRNARQEQELSQLKEGL